MRTLTRPRFTSLVDKAVTPGKTVESFSACVSDALRGTVQRSGGSSRLRQLWAWRGDWIEHTTEPGAEHAVVVRAADLKKQIGYTICGVVGSCFDQLQNPTPCTISRSKRHSPSYSSRPHTPSLWTVPL